MQRARLVAAFLAFAILCVGVAALSVWRDRAATQEQAIRDVAAMARLLDEHASRAIEWGDFQLRYLLEVMENHDLDDRETLQRVWSTLRRNTERMPHVSAAWVVDAHGTMILDSAQFPATPVDLSQRSYVAAHRDGQDGLFFGPSEAGARTGQERFTLSRALHDGEGRLHGVVAVSIPSAYFATLHGDSGWEPGARLSLHTLENERLAEWPPPSPSDRMPPDQMPSDVASPRAATWTQPWTGVDGPARIDGDRIVAARKLAAFPVVVTTSRSLDAVLAGWRERAAWTAGLTGCILAGAALLLPFALGGIRRERAMRARLVQVNRSLDDRVRHRTAELESALRAAETASLAKMKVLATVSHDLRQPLQGLAAFHELLLRESPNPDLHRLGAMATASLRAGQRLLDDLLTLSRLEAGVVPVEVAPLALAPLLEQVAAEMRAVAEAKGLRLTVVTSTLWVRSDPARLQQILRNLLSNAVKYTARGGVLLGARRCGERVSIEVWDSGQGIAEAELGTIWEEFYQIGNPARDGSRGAGLGLSIVERTARLLDHRLDVRSRERRGSVFAVVVPRVAAPATAAHPPAESRDLPAPGPPGGRLRGRLVLVVEDDPLQRGSLTLVLERAGAVVVAVDTFDAAMAASRAALHRPSAILSDYRLPGGVDGLSGIKALRTVFGAELPALLLTGELSAELTRAAKAAGCALMTKPAPPEHILTVLADLTARVEVV